MGASVRRAWTTKLGSGFESDVYLLRSYANLEDGFVLKRYRWWATEHVEVVNTFDNGLAGYQILNEIGGGPFKVPKIRTISAALHTIELEWIKGSPFNQVLSSPGLSPEQKAAAVRLWNNSAKAFSEHLMKVAAEKKWKLRITRGSQDGIVNYRFELQRDGEIRPVNFWLKPDNVVIDPDSLALSIIDPM